MSGLDHKMYDQTLEASHQLMDLTIEHILFIVRMCRSVHVIQPTLKLIGVLMVWKLEAFTENVQPLKGRNAKRMTLLSFTTLLMIIDATIIYLFIYLFIYLLIYNT